MVDLNHYYGGDVATSPSGDLAVADGPTTGVQRVYRRLLTNPAMSDDAGNPISSPDYTWQPEYGAGLAQKIGSPGSPKETAALINGQMLMESAVSAKPLPVISLTQTGNVSSVTIGYTDANSASPQFLDFDVTS